MCTISSHLCTALAALGFRQAVSFSVTFIRESFASVVQTVLCESIDITSVALRMLAYFFSRQRN